MPSDEVARDTIAAIATPAGRGGIGVIRLSGPAVPDIACAVLGRLPEARRATLASFRDAHGEPQDKGIALYFPAPHSYTGEPVLELQGHGGLVVLQTRMNPKPPDPVQAKVMQFMPFIFSIFFFFFPAGLVLYLSLIHI